LAQITRHENSTEPVGGSLARLSLNIAQHYPGPSPGELFGHSQTNAASRSGDDHHFILKKVVSHFENLIV
jgi:hypothetical protein